MSYDFNSIQKMFVRIIVQERTNAYWFEQFIEEINNHNPSDVSVVESFLDSEDSDEELDETKDTLTLLTEYVGSLDIKNNKDELINLLRELYSEAMSIDKTNG
jgi:hypothetical protein